MTTQCPEYFYSIGRNTGGARTPFSGWSGLLPARTQCCYALQRNPGAAFRGTKVHALLTQVQSVMVECRGTTTHHVVRGRQSMDLPWHFLAGRMFPLHSLTARRTDEVKDGGIGLLFRGDPYRISPVLVYTPLRLPFIPRRGQAPVEQSAGAFYFRYLPNSSLVFLRLIPTGSFRIWA